jgi:hypothetical protein
MKKFIILGLFVTLLTTVAGAQNGPGDRFRHQRIREGYRDGQINRAERFRLHRNEARFKIARRHARRDGVVGPVERRRLHQMKRHQRHQIFRYKHNHHRRVM